MPASSHYHSGEKVQLRLRLGEMLLPIAVDKLENASTGLNAQVLTPDGRTLPALVSFDGAAGWLVEFTAAGEGWYHVVATWRGEEAGNSLTLYGQLLVPVGHHIHGAPAAADLSLAFYVDHWHTVQAGKELHLQLRAGNAPLAGAEVLLARQGPAGEQRQVLTCDEHGRLTVVAAEPGFYLLAAGREEEKERIITTFYFMALK